MNWRLLAAALGVCVGLVTAFSEDAMADLTIFSAVQGQVTSGGQPVAGATVERSWRWMWKKEDGADSAMTAADGSFAFPAIARRSLFGSLVPHEPFVEQTMLIRFQGQTFKAWMLDKRNYEANGELDGKPIRLICRLEAPFQRHGRVSGICEIR